MLLLRVIMIIRCILFRSLTFIRCLSNSPGNPSIVKRNQVLIRILSKKERS